MTSKLDATSIPSTGPGRLSVADRAGLEEEVNQISANIRDMRRKFNDIAKHLPAHDLRSFENACNTFYKQIYSMGVLWCGFADRISLRFRD